jgi:hypothetical protein
MSPPLVEILIRGITAWFNDSTLPVKHFEFDYQQLLREQAQIGWSHIFQGRITTQWSLLQHDYYSGFPPVKGRNGESWSCHILCHIFTHWLLLWDDRNKDCHGRDSKTRFTLTSIPSSTKIPLSSLMTQMNTNPSLPMPFGSGSTRINHL